MSYENAEKILEAGLGDAYPCVGYAVGCKDKLFKSGILGDRQTYPEPIAADRDTLFDLASLSKLVATTMVALRFIEEGKLLLTDTLGRYFDGLSGTPRADVTVLQLMTHSSGISPYVALWKQCRDRSEAVRAILDSAPMCAPGEQVYYSCMGYILLQKILEKISGKQLDQLAKEYVFSPLGMTRTLYCPEAEPDVVTTELSPLYNEYIKGHVHDENAHWLGGISGNAGVFSCLDDMIKFAEMISSGGRIDGKYFLNPRTFEKATSNYTPGKYENRGLGFQLTPPISSLTGDLFSEGSYGHTGFTGTALYVDRESGLWGLLLTNAVHYGRDNKVKFFRIRRAFYNSIADEFFRSM